MKRNKIIKAIALVTLAIGLNIKSYAVNFYDTLGTRYENSTEILAELGIVKGTKANVFDADKEVTRAEFTKMLVESSLKPSERYALIIDDSEINFTDVSRDEWYYEYVVIAVNRGFIQGFDDNTFRPDEGVTYSQIAKLITKALGHDYLKDTNPAGWDYEYLDKVYELNLFKDVSKSDPHDKATRGNCAIIIWNMLTTTTWKMIYRNDVAGFSYVDSGVTLFDQKIIDHEYMLNAQINGFAEINGNIYVNLRGRYYKLFDQETKINYSMINGFSDIILKRVEYPGLETHLEVAYINTDVGSQLFEGTNRQLKEDGFETKYRARLSENADYSYIYHYEDGETQDRVISVNTSDFYVVEKIKVEDKGPEGEKKEEDKSHSEVKSQFEDDIINFRYSSKDKEFIRTISINEGKVFIQGGAVLFYNNERMKWDDLKKGDVIVEISPNMYYMKVKTTSLNTTLVDYSTKKSNYTITTPDMVYDTYPKTMYANYTSSNTKLFNKLSEKELSDLKGRPIRITFDDTDRVLQIDLANDEIKFADINIGFYEEFTWAKQMSVDNSQITLLVDGKKKNYDTKMNGSKLVKGALVYLEFDEKEPKLVKSAKEIKGDVTLSGKIKAKTIKLEEFLNKLEFFDDDELQIYKTVYHYNLGDYENVTKYDVSKISIKEASKLRGASYDVLGITDENDVFRMFIIRDYSEVQDTYYGVIKRVQQRTYYDDKDKDHETKLREYHLFIQQVGKKEIDYYLLIGDNDYAVNDFIKYFPSKDTVQVLEKYSLDMMGYKKDFEITSVNKLDKHSKTVDSYDVNGMYKLDAETMILDYGDDQYDIKDYDVFLLNVSKTENNNWEITQARTFKDYNIPFEVGDMLAFDEIEDALVIYRGYKR